MKRSIAYGLAVALLAACTAQEKDLWVPSRIDRVFYATFEQPSEEGTRVYVNEDLKVLWDEGDEISIFNKKDANDEYRFTGKTGDNGGTFELVKDFSEEGVAMDLVHAVYPYSRATSIDLNGTLSVNLPSEQFYRENSFGLGANLMVSVSKDQNLMFRNACGYLCLNLYGEGVSVSSITLKGNNGEKLAGNATVTMPLDGVPSLVMSEDATTELTLTCTTPVQLGATAEESTVFWFVVPPVTFNDGFTVTVNKDDGGAFEKSTPKMVLIDRNKLRRMSLTRVDKSPDINYTYIYYSSTDGEVVTPYNPDAFGAKIVSNVYSGGSGKITCAGEVSSIGEEAFYECENLAGIIVPNGVTSIGYSAFAECTNLISVELPSSLTSIGDIAFADCVSLTGISIPDSVTSIGNLAFEYSGLASITIPNSVTTIGRFAFAACDNLADISLSSGLTSLGDYAFSACSSLTSVTIPGSVTSFGDSAFSSCYNLTTVIFSNGLTAIGRSAFWMCTSLTDIVFPNSLTDIGSCAFYCCSSLADIVFPESLTSIGYCSFYGCSSLYYITIPDSVTSIGEGVFGGCYSLDRFAGKYATEDGLFLIDSGTIIAVANAAIENGEVDVSYYFIDRIGDCAFSSCFRLARIVLPGGMTSFGVEAFHGSGLKSIVIPYGITCIEYWTFADCHNLTSVTIPDSVTSIEQGAFTSCSLTEITLPESLISIGNLAFDRCRNLTGITVLAETPPSCSSTSFNETNNCPIYVPEYCVDTYKAAPGWSEYAERIIAIEE